MPVAGKYRLIDIPISNCINSGLNRIYVLTQFLSVSLHRHIANTYKFDPFSRGFVEVLAAQQTNEAADWYQGTADAVRQNIRYVENEDCRGRPDPLRRPALPHGLPPDPQDPPRQRGRRHHRRPPGQGGPDVRVRAHADRRHRPRRRLRREAQDRAGAASRTSRPPSGSRSAASRATAGTTWPAWASTCSTAEVLLRAAQRPAAGDRLRQGDLPAQRRDQKVQAHLFDGYWEDLGTIKATTRPTWRWPGRPAVRLLTPEGVIYTRMRNLPASRVDGATLKRCLVGDGCADRRGHDARPLPDRRPQPDRQQLPADATRS